MSWLQPTCPSSSPLLRVSSPPELLSRPATKRFRSGHVLPGHGTFPVLLFFVVYIPSPFPQLAHSYSSFKVQLKYLLPVKVSLTCLPWLGSWRPLHSVPLALCIYRCHSKQLSHFFLSDIPLAMIPCLRIHSRQILCAASPPASRCHVSVENTHAVFSTMKSGNCFKTKSFPGGINHQVSCGSIRSAMRSAWWLFWFCTRHYIHFSFFFFNYD